MNKILQFPLVRIVVGVLSVVVGLLVGQTALNLLRTSFAITSTGLANLLAFVVITPAAYFAYWLFVRFVERRDMTELGRTKALGELGLGSLLGLILFSFIIAVLWWLSYYHVNGFNLIWLALLGTLAGAFVSSFVQELIFRAVVYRITEEWLGTWWAIAVSAISFGLIHLTSAGATIFSVLAVALQAGVLLAAAYALTHRLWLALGIHLGWDFANDGIFGVGVAGQTGQSIQGLLQANLNGPKLFTGGALGVEASLVTLVVILIVSFILLRRVRRKGQWGSRQTEGWLTERLGKTS